MPMHDVIDRATGVLFFLLTALVLLAAPWLFGAWEMWWFWPLTTVLFGAVLLFAVRLVFFGCGYPPRTHVNRRLSLTLLLGWAIFVFYVLIRFYQAPVYLDAERSMLLFVTPLLLGTAIAFGFSRRQLEALFILILLNMLALGVYAVVNWYKTRGEFVMWQPAYPQYILDERASGSYYCPNHFAGVMEIAFLAGLALLITRHKRIVLRLLALPLLVVAVWAILLTKSRGAALSLGVVSILVLAVGFLQWRPAFRHALAVVVIAATVGGTFAAVTLDVPFVQRFRRYPWRQLEYASRYQMIGGAMRAWRSAPIWGIGPGMHRHLWPHFAAGTDGDRDTARWPRHRNDTFHSYEVHSDWVQLLEEYGVVGFLLFLTALGATMTLWVAALKREWRRQRAASWRAPGRFDYTVVLTALLSGAVMAVHSLGDFNLQMPATVWLLGGIVAIAVAFILRDTEPVVFAGGSSDGIAADGATL